MSDHVRKASSAIRPKQARSEQTQQRILEAAEALITEKGLADASVPEIARRADSSVGGFYARFSDKDALLLVLEERFFAEMLLRVHELADAERWADAPVVRIVEALGEELVVQFRERRNLIAAFIHRASTDPAALAPALAFRSRVSDAVTALLAGRAEVRHPDPALAIDLGVQFAIAMMLQAVLLGDIRAAGRVLSDREIQSQLVRNFLTYIGAQVDDPKTPGERTRP